MSYVTTSETEQGSNRTQSAAKQAARQGRRRRQAARHALSRACAPALSLEGLESRTLLSTLPTPNITTRTDVSGGGAGVDQSSPSIAYDPKNPQKLVTVYTTNNPGAGGTQKVFIGGKYSINGGATWSSFSIPSNIINPTASPEFETPSIYLQATDATVSFDLNDNFYVAYSQHNTNFDSGAIVMQKYSFADSAPELDPIVQDAVLYQWSTNDAAYSPVVVVDNNQLSYTDPDTGKKQEDLNSNNIYVAWSTNNKAPTGASNFNPNVVRMMASSDGGETFGTPVLIDGNNSGSDRNGYPKIAVSQGTSDGRVEPGLVTVLWDDFGSGHTGPNPVDRIMAGSIAEKNRTYAAFDKVGGDVDDALVGTPDTPVSTDFLLPVVIADADSIITDLDVFLNIKSDSLGDLEIKLTDPLGLNTVTLVRNKTAPNGTQTNGRGVSGADFGLINGYDVPVVMDDSAARRINDANANNPYSGYFRPELGALDVFNDLTAAEASGNWKLTITDNKTGNLSTLNSWSLHINSGLVVSNTVEVATTTVLGANAASTFPLKPASNPDRGVGPGAVIASDNTLGSFSPYEGRLYVAYVDRLNASGNPSDNTDIKLKTSDDGGETWDNAGLVNDDDATTDGYSEALGDDFNTIRGRIQFMPSIAVDQTTGTLVMTWYDGRNDPARAQVATYIGTSIDGGATFSEQTFLNTPNVVTDAITGNQTIRGPIPENQSTNNTNNESDYGFGDHQGLAAVGGKVYPVWSGNLNGGVLGQTLLHIWTATTTIASGPRIVKSTMGPVSLSGDTVNPAAADGSPKFAKFEVQFDRPIDPASFSASSVKVFFRSPTTLGTAPGISVPVTSVTPLDAGTFGPADAAGATKFLVTLTTPQTTVGTYSYYITPDMRDRVRHLGTTITPVAPANFAASGNQINVSIPTSGTGGSNTANDIRTSTLNVSGVPAAQVISSLKVNVNLTHSFDDDLILTLIAPDGRRILLSSNNGGSGDNYTNTIFDDAGMPITASVAPFTGTFAPEEKLGQLAGMNPNGDWKLEINDTGAGDSGTLISWSLTVTPGTVGAGLGNKLDQNNNGSTAQAATAVSTGDVYAIPEPVGGLPFNGNYFLPPFSTDTAPIIIPGPHVVSSKVNGNPVTADNLVLNKTVSNIDITFDRPMDATTITPAAVVNMVGPLGKIAGPFTVTPISSTTYRIGFPTQTFSGTYSLTLASSIKSAAGDTMDTNLNAGVDALRVVSNVTVPVTTSAADVPQSIGTKVVESSINITDAFLIKGATLQLNITYPNDPDLTGTLVAPDGTQITLFSNVGAAGVNKANFSNTIFDDAAATPIQNGQAPFFARFNPQLPLGVLIGKLSTGKWTLQIRSSGAGVGTLNSWSLMLTKPVPGTGLGEAAADRASASFRIFTMATNNAQSQNTWTPVGPGSENNNDNGGRIGGLAVDPSDPSGNTVYAGGSAGGIWKTTNFLTTDPKGPTWVPLTDFGPTTSLNIGSIAVFGQNNDPNQSIIFAATGFGDNNEKANELTAAGVGFLRSMDGGATWTLLDSTTNVDGSGNPLPISSVQRDHKFVGTNAFKVLVDPKPTPSGDVIVYAALSGPEGGVWRSLDSGKHWSKMRAGQATDIVFDLNSGFFDALNNPTGNLQYIYAAFQGQGIYFSPNRGTVWNQLLGDVGNPLIRDNTSGSTAVQVDQPATLPNGNKGRITLAKPALTGNALNDIQYQGWLYAVVSEDDGNLDGIYVTKDFGQNWTKIRIPVYSTVLPSNDVGLADDPIFSAQGNYDQSLAVDPTNPAIVYVGGARNGTTPSDVLRIDTTFLHDAHSFYQDDANGNGELRPDLNNPVEMRDWPDGRSQLFPNAVDSPYINLVRDPQNPFLANATVNVINASSFTNDGGGATWTPFSENLTDLGGNQHRMLTMVDPLTGKSRIIVGTDLGVFTAVDNDGAFQVSFGSQTVPTGTRNGNMQVAAFNYGAVQPSNLAAQLAGALFYAQANDNNGQLQSTADILTTGDNVWVGPIGNGTGVATDQTGTGTAYRYNWPLSNRFLNGITPAGTTDFFMVTPPGSAPGTGVSRTFGLLQDSQPGSIPDPQWPGLIGSNFAVNPINKDQIIISSQAGRIFATGNQGVIWTEIGNPTALDSSYAPALAYGAPDPNGPGGADAVNFFLYAGTTEGNIFVTFNGGGANGNEWTEISAGLDGSPVQTIITNPTRGSHEAYAVTQQGVYYLADSTVASPVWVKITGNILTINHNPFGDPILAETKAKSLSALVADWRYAIPDDLNDQLSPTHPVLYVSGGSGVYRSFDKGKTWTLFPNQDTDQAPADGGLLPSVHVSDLDLGIGNIDPATGQPTVAGSPDVLLATTYGRGSFAIRIAPTVVPGTLKLVGTPGGAQPLTFSGISELTAFGNKVRISIYNLTSGTPVYVAGWNGTDNGTGTDTAANRTDAKGVFSVQVPSNAFGPGTRIIGVRLTDDAGVTYTGLLTFPPAVPSVPNLVNASDTGISNTDNITNDTTPTFSGTADPGVKVTILSDGIAVGNDVADGSGNWTVTASALAAGNRNITATATDIASNVSSAPSAALPITIDVTPPAAPSTPDLIAASDSGSSNTDNITNVTTPTFSGTAEKGATVTLYEGAVALGTAVADINTGNWSILSSALGNGGHSITAKATDVAGNTSVASGALVVTVDVIVPNTPGTPDLVAASDDGVSSTDNITSITTPQFTGTADANTAIDLLADGNVVGTGTSNGAGVWTITSSALAGGTYSITARARDTAGNNSLPSVGLTVQITAPLPAPSTPDLATASDDGPSSTDNITTVKTPTFTGTGPANTTIELLTGGNTVVGTGTANGAGAWSITVANALADGVYSFTARAKTAQTTGPQSGSLSVTITSSQLSVPSTPDLTSLSDTGSSNSDNLTNDQTPTFTGTGPASTTIELLIGGNTVVGTATSNASGNWSITSSSLAAGTYSFTARSTNGQQTSGQSGSLSVTIDTTAPGTPGAPDLTAASDTGASSTDNNTTDNTPTFTGTGPANTLIDLMVNNTVFGSTTSDGSGNWTITSSALPNGTFVFSARSRDTAGNTSPLSTGLTVTITNSPPPPPPLTISSYTLINADTGKDIMEMVEGMVLDLSALPARLAIRANPSPTNVASIKFGYDETPGSFKSNYRTESILPYAVFADSANGTKYNPGIFKVGNHTLSGTPYSKVSASGTVGQTLTLKFSVVNGTTPPPPTNASATFTLVNADTGADLMTITEGSTVDLTKLPANLSVRGNPTVGGVGSLKFGYDLNPGSFNANFHTESQAPFSLNGDGSGKYTPVKFNVGSHTLSATLFSGSGGNGTNLGNSTVHFTVTGTVQPPAQATVTSFSLINAGNEQVIKTLVEGETLNLASLPASLAIRANTSGTVGSVVFGWDATPGSINQKFRVESGAPYTLFGDNNNGADYIGGTLAKGAHTLIGTVYSSSGGTGTKLGSLTLHFTVT